MFSVIVSTGLQSSRTGSILASRVFSHTDERLSVELRKDGKLDVERLLDFPTILMEEGTGNELAGVCKLSRIERRGHYFHFSFLIDQELPRFTNADFKRIASELDIDDWEFQTNHWSVKNVDLFQVLLREDMRRRRTPAAFRLSQNPTNDDLVSVMMPFSDQNTDVYVSLQSSLEEAGFRCVRADDFWLHSHIIDDIIELICTSRIVVCDLSGKNPNVFYEAGIAHTLGKDVILIAQSLADVPFDLRSMRCICYLNNREGREKMTSELLARVKTIVRKS